MQRGQPRVLSHPNPNPNPNRDPNPNLSTISLCRQVMNVLWTNKGSVLAMLEAFVYDPLINWRLLKTTKV